MNPFFVEFFALHHIALYLTRKGNSSSFKKEITLPVYLCKTLKCTCVHNFVKTLRNYTNLFMSSFFLFRRNGFCLWLSKVAFVLFWGVVSQCFFFPSHF
uniref:Uncharacterized protein n=1 Tax=Anguilla anguilla TaxID=7936 RepID=A0A0E9XH35_ANGAN